MKVMLVYPNDRMDSLIPIGLSVLSAHLKAAGHEVKLYDTTFYDTGKETGDFYRESLGQIIPVDLKKYGIERKKITKEELCKDFRKAILEYQPGLIGFSTLEINYDQGLELVKSIQNIPIPKIFGGIYPTFAPRIVLREPAIDMICEGEGEEMLPELATALEKKQDVTKILNLTIKQDGKIYRSGEVVGLNNLPTGDDFCGEKTGLRRLLINMENVLLTPDYSIYDDKRFWKKMSGKVVRTVAVELSRGCQFSCSFCCIPMQKHQHKVSREKYSKFSGLELTTLKKEDSFHREKPIDKFISEVKYAIENYGINYIYFTDESFLSMKEERFKEFIEKYNRIELPFFIETRVETVKPGYAKDLEDVGCVGIAMGIESGSLNIRKTLLNRLTKNEDIINAFREFEKTNIRISANNIIGFPGETRKDIMETVEINKKISADSIIVNAFRPYSGTRLRKICIENNLIPTEERVEDNRTYSAFYNGVMSAAEIEGIRRMFNFYVRFPKNRWNEIRKAETDETIHKALKQEIEQKILYRKKQNPRV
jgi:radical SAM superfamily enzyme YgiQ (UPF0313 family)